MKNYCCDFIFYGRSSVLFIAMNLCESEITFWIEIELIFPTFVPLEKLELERFCFKKYLKEKFIPKSKIHIFLLPVGYLSI